MGNSPKRYTVDPDRVEAILRAELGESDEAGALDGEAWLAWTLVGLRVFSGSTTLREARGAAERVAVAIAMVREHGNVSGAARSLGMTRKVLRDVLRRHGLYPWRWPHRRVSLADSEVWAVVLGDSDYPDVNS